MIRDYEVGILNSIDNAALSRLRNELASFYIKLKNTPELSRLMYNVNYDNFQDIIFNKDKQYGDTTFYDVFYNQMLSHVEEKKPEPIVDESWKLKYVEQLQPKSEIQEQLESNEPEDDVNNSQSFLQKIRDLF